jgi:hypothetical protein
MRAVAKSDDGMPWSTAVSECFCSVKTQTGIYAMTRSRVTYRMAALSDSRFANARFFSARQAMGRSRPVVDALVQACRQPGTLGAGPDLPIFDAWRGANEIF